MTDDILFSRVGAVARIVFDRSHARNALTFAMYDRLATLCTEATADRSIRALVLAGAGDGAFAAGTDPSEYNAEPSRADAEGYVARLEAALATLEGCPVATVAAVGGICTGDGALVAACCDVRIGTRATRVGLPLSRTLGACVSRANMMRLADVFGPARAKELVLTGRLMEADEAERLGFLSEIVADSTALATRADALAGTLATHAPETIAAAKAALLARRAAMAGDEAAVAGYLTPTFREGLQAFRDKRRPLWAR